MWPFGSNDGEDTKRRTITEDSAVYIDGRLACPRCDNPEPAIGGFTSKRNLECWNCGLSLPIDEGVLLHQNIDEEMEAQE